MNIVVDREIPKLIYQDYDHVHRLVEKIYKEGNAYTYDFETLSTRVARIKVTGLGMAWGKEEGQGKYILTRHTEHPHLDWEKVLEIVKPLLEDPSMTQIAHNMLFDATILDYWGVNLHTNTYDTMVMAWMLNTDTPNGLKGLIKRLYGHQMTELTEFCATETVSWNPDRILRLDKAPIDKMREYAVDDVLWTYRLWEDALEAIQSEENLNKVYHELYQEYLLILTQMQSDGVRLDVGFLAEREEKTRVEMDELILALIQLRPGQDFDDDCSEWGYVDIDTQRKKIDELQKKWSAGRNNGQRELLYAHPHLAGKLFNPDSPQQVASILFDELGLDPISYTDTGNPSVAADVMAKLKHRDPTGFVEKLMRYSTLSKLQGTYHIGLQQLVDDDGRIRTSFNPALKTGRLSSSGPNLQNIPARTEDGKLIRKAFIPKDGYKFIVADYSQMELRITAHFSEDPIMIEGFKKGADPHSITAKAIFELDGDVLEVKEKYPTQRTLAKTVNFAVLYGAGAEKLSTQMAEATNGEVIPTMAEAQGYKDALFERMPGVKAWIDYQERLAKREGAVFTLIGRPRHLPDAQQYENKAGFFGALRRAVNSPIQGSAADIIAIAKRNMRRDFLERGWWRESVWLILQVHDELIFEVREDLVEEVFPLIKHHMEHAVELLVPIVAEPEVGDSWYAAK